MFFFDLRTLWFIWTATGRECEIWIGCFGNLLTSADQLQVVSAKSVWLVTSKIKLLHVPEINSQHLDLSFLDLGRCCQMDLDFYIQSRTCQNLGGVWCNHLGVINNGVLVFLNPPAWIRSPVQILRMLHLVSCDSLRALACIVTSSLSSVNVLGIITILFGDSTTASWQCHKGGSVRSWVHGFSDWLVQSSECWLLLLLHLPVLGRWAAINAVELNLWAWASLELSHKPYGNCHLLRVMHLETPGTSFLFIFFWCR